ncbi:hypothetical protein RHIZ404_230654 [Rhizobium sp. EC-SD404]|nr:hypothetical protein RHIZ404_230654 [Rhizobium sp. EC-SD404]
MHFRRITAERCGYGVLPGIAFSVSGVRQTLSGDMANPDRRFSALKVRTVKMTYDPARRGGDSADEITFRGSGICCHQRQRRHVDEESCGVCFRVDRNEHCWPLLAAKLNFRLSRRHRG